MLAILHVSVRSMHAQIETKMADFILMTFPKVQSTNINSPPTRHLTKLQTVHVKRNTKPSIVKSYTSGN